MALFVAPAGLSSVEHLHLE